MHAKLILKDGVEFTGKLLKATDTILGEVVFNTSMSGYQEIFTDPSYAGQIVVMTYPLIGNYGVFQSQSESSSIPIKGIIIHDLYDGPIHPQAQMSLKEFLIKNNIPTLTGVDTRALAKHIRSHGTIPGLMTNKEIHPDTCQEIFQTFTTKKLVKENSTPTIKYAQEKKSFHIVLMDFGYKKSIKEELEKRGARVTLIPNTISQEELDQLNPDGVLLSNGPGDPKDALHATPVIRHIQEHYPTFGICLGHQMLAIANGADTFKMSFGHRGANHSVKDIKNGKVFLSSQNHSFAVDSNTLAQTKLRPRFLNVNDKTIEGLEHESKPVFSVQFHPEANAGPEDTSFLFDEFVNLVHKNLELKHVI